jgi:hypothetical protein
MKTRGRSCLLFIAFKYPDVVLNDVAFLPNTRMNQETWVAIKSTCYSKNTHFHGDPTAIFNPDTPNYTTMFASLRYRSSLSDPRHSVAARSLRLAPVVGR